MTVWSNSEGGPPAATIQGVDVMSKHSQIPRLYGSCTLSLESSIHGAHSKQWIVDNFFTVNFLYFRFY